MEDLPIEAPMCSDSELCQHQGFSGMNFYPCAMGTAWLCTRCVRFFYIMMPIHIGPGPVQGSGKVAGLLLLGGGSLKH